MKLLLVAMIACFAVGCQNLQMEKPGAAVKGMTVRDVNSAGFTMNFDVEVTNPNEVALPLTNADYKLGLAGVKLVDGKVTADGAVPAKGSRSVAVPITLTYESLLAAEKAIVQSGGNIDYALDAGVSVNTGSALFGDMRVPLKYSGKLNLKDLLKDPTVLLQSPAAKKLAMQLLGSFFGK